MPASSSRPEPAKAQATVGSTLQRSGSGDLPCHFLRTQNIVRIQILHVLTTGNGEAAILCAGCSTVGFLVEDYSASPSTGEKFMKRLQRPIGRAIVNNDNLNIPISL
jgi:hypothetical protein